jgi:hypothetical protein
MDKIILVFYIYVGDLSEGRIEELFSDLKSNYYGEWESDNTIAYWIPIREGDTRVECINPRLVGPEEYEKVKSEIERAKVVLGEFTNNELKKS